MGGFLRALVAWGGEWGTQGEPRAADVLTWSNDDVTAVQQALESGRQDAGAG